MYHGWSDLVSMNSTTASTVPKLATVSPSFSFRTLVSFQTRRTGVPPDAVIDGRVNGAGILRRVIGCLYGAPVMPCMSMLSPVEAMCPGHNGEHLIGDTVAASPCRQEAPGQSPGTRTSPTVGTWGWFAATSAGVPPDQRRSFMRVDQPSHAGACGPPAQRALPFPVQIREPPGGHTLVRVQRRENVLLFQFHRGRPVVPGRAQMPEDSQERRHVE